MDHRPAALPDLRIVALADILLHEDADERRVTVLARRLAADGQLRSPPVVAPLGDGRFVVLDGANRASALRLLGVRDVLVQVADYGGVRLTSWSHLVVGWTTEQLLGAISSLSGLAQVTRSLADARLGLSTRDLLAYCVTPTGEVRGLSGADSLAPRGELLRQVVGTYRGRAHIHRVETDDMAALRTVYTEIAALVVFPPFSPPDILAMADQGLRLPAGITRHVIRGRALRVNVDLDVLGAETLLAEKNHWLAERTRGQQQAGRVRYYEESTFLFDE